MVTVEEKLYNKMPDEIKSCFKMLPNPGSDEVLDLFPNTGQPCGSVKKTTHKDGMFGIGQPGAIYTAQDGDNRSAARFFYCAKASKAERNRGCEGLEEKDASKMSGGEETRPDRPTNHPRMSNFHPTVKPIALMEYLIKLVSREGHTILDPFIGSGTTGIACKKLNRNFIGIERDQEYMEIAKARINNSKIQTKLI